MSCVSRLRRPTRQGGTNDARRDRRLCSSGVDLRSVWNDQSWTQKKCRGCGAPQPQDQDFELSPQQELISDEEELRRAKSGPDVHCGYCGARNSADAETCVQCGAPMAEGMARQAGEVLGAAQFEAMADVACPFCGAMNPGSATKCGSCGGSLTRPKPKPESRAVPLSVLAADGKSKKGLGIVAILGIVLACVIIVGAVAFLSQTSEQTGVVREVSWEQSIDIQELRPVTYDDWHDEIPSGVEMGTCTQKYRYASSEPVPGAKKVCGTAYVKDQGSGYGKVVQECEYEVYDEWCEYLVDEWKVVQTERAVGNDLNPVWPEVRVTSGQRDGERSESYKVVFLSNDKVYTYSTNNLDEFKQYESGSKWKLHVNKLGALTDIEK